MGRDLLTRRSTDTCKCEEFKHDMQALYTPIAYCADTWHLIDVIIKPSKYLYFSKYWDTLSLKKLKKKNNYTLTMEAVSNKTY